MRRTAPNAPVATQASTLTLTLTTLLALNTPLAGLQQGMLRDTHSPCRTGGCAHL